MRIVQAVRQGTALLLHSLSASAPRAPRQSCSLDRFSERCAILPWLFASLHEAPRLPPRPRVRAPASPVAPPRASRYPHSSALPWPPRHSGSTHRPTFLQLPPFRLVVP